MGPTQRSWLFGFCVIATASWASVSRAAGDSPEDVLKKNGLKQAGPMYVLEAESAAKKKLTEVRQLSRQLKIARLQQATYGTAQDHQALMQNLSAQVNQIKAEINAVNQQVNRLPRFRNRFANTYAQAEHAELLAYRNQLNAELAQQNNLLTQVKTHPPDPKIKEKIDADVHARQEEYEKEVSDLAQLVSSTQEKYAALSKDNEVKRALAALELKIRPSPQLGPSHEFHALVKVVDKLRNEPAEASPEPKAKAVRKSRRSTK
jgi:chromosome segregation ATPase